MRILFVSHETEYSYGVYLRVVTRALAARGHDVRILNCSPFNAREPTEEDDHGVVIYRRRHVRLRGASRLQQIPGVRQLVTAARAPAAPAWTSPVVRLNAAVTNVLEYRRLGFDADVIEAPEHLAEGLGLALLRIRPVVVELHGPLRMVVPYSGFRPGRHLKDLRLARADGCVGRDHRRRPVHVPRSRPRGGRVEAARSARIIPHAIDLDMWEELAPASSTARIVLAVGDIGPAKGSDVLVRSVAKLAASVPNVELIFVGASISLATGESSEQPVIRLARQLGVRCRIVGHVPRAELADWYAMARVVAIPSRFDSFSQAGLEAMASGRPVVCSTRVGLADIARPALEGLTVVPADDSDALAAALEPFLRDPARAATAGRQARDLARSRCAPAVVAAEREAVYREAAARSRTRVGGARTRSAKHP